MKTQTVWSYLVGAHLRAGAGSLFIKFCLNFAVTVLLAALLTPFVFFFDGVRYLYEKVTGQE